MYSLAILVKYLLKENELSVLDGLVTTYIYDE